MAEIVKLIAAEIDLTSANTVNNASVVRINNNSGNAVLITRANADTIGTVTLASGEIVYLQKAPSDTFASNVAVRAVSVSFS